MNNAFIKKYDKWLLVFLLLTSKQEEALWWCGKRYANQQTLKNQCIANWKWSCTIGIHVQNPLESFPTPELLLPRFDSPNTILRFELPEKIKFPILQPPLLYIWGERNHIQNLFHNQRKIKKCYIEQLQHLNYKLQEQERNKKHIWKKMTKTCFNQK